MRSKNNAVNIVTRLRSGQKESRASIPGKGKNFFSSRELQDRVCNLPGLVFKGYRKHTGRGESSHLVHFCRVYEWLELYLNTPLPTCLCGVHRGLLPIHVGLLLSITLLDIKESNTQWQGKLLTNLKRLSKM